MRPIIQMMVLLASALLALAVTRVPFRTQILRPDGTPADGASVLLRVLKEENGTLREERTVTADAQGKVDTALEFAAEPTGSCLWPRR